MNDDTAKTVIVVGDPRFYMATIVEHSVKDYHGEILIEGETTLEGAEEVAKDMALHWFVDEVEAEWHEEENAAWFPASSISVEVREVKETTKNQYIEHVLQHATYHRLERKDRGDGR